MRTQIKNDSSEKVYKIPEFQLLSIKGTGVKNMFEILVQIQDNHYQKRIFLFNNDKKEIVGFSN